MPRRSRARRRCLRTSRRSATVGRRAWCVPRTIVQRTTAGSDSISRVAPASDVPSVSTCQANCIASGTTWRRWPTRMVTRRTARPSARASAARATAWHSDSSCTPIPFLSARAWHHCTTAATALSSHGRDLVPNGHLVTLLLDVEKEGDQIGLSTSVRVSPGVDAIAALAAFDEELPDDGTAAADTLRLLDGVGARRRWPPPAPTTSGSSTGRSCRWRWAQHGSRRRGTRTRRCR